MLYKLREFLTKGKRGQTNTRVTDPAEESGVGMCTYLVHTVTVTGLKEHDSKLLLK